MEGTETGSNMIHVGQRVIVVRLLYVDVFPGTVIAASTKVKTCTVKSDRLGEVVRNVIYYDECPGAVNSQLLQICYPEDSDA